MKLSVLRHFEKKIYTNTNVFSNIIFKYFHMPSKQIKYPFQKWFGQI